MIGQCARCGGNLARCMADGCPMDLPTTPKFVIGMRGDRPIHYSGRAEHCKGGENDHSDWDWVTCSKCLRSKPSEVEPIAVVCENCGHTSSFDAIIPGMSFNALCFKCCQHTRVGNPPRPSWDEYFMHLAVIASTRGTCSRRQVGCIIVSRDKNVLSTGYNGSAPGAPHCDDAGHLMHDGHCARTIHGETNAVAQAARNGVALEGGKAYVTTHPCPPCLLLLASAGVRDLVVLEPYHGDEDAISAVLACDASITVTEYQGSKPWAESIDR